MAEGGQGEKASFGKFVKNRGYGTTNKTSATPDESFIKHSVVAGETLQGIALKYGVTMEQIKRVNKIWTNDSLFLREYLLIPLVRSPLQDGSACVNGLSVVSPTDVHEEIVTRKDLEALSKNANSGKNKVDMNGTESSRRHSAPATSKADEGATYFLNKFDSSLAQIRSNVQKLEETSNFQDDASNPLLLLPSKRVSRYRTRNKSRSYDIDDPTNEPELAFKSRYRSKQIKSSVEHLQRTDDDMFQL